MVPEALASTSGVNVAPIATPITARVGSTSDFGCDSGRPLIANSSATNSGPSIHGSGNRTQAASSPARNATAKLAA